MTEEEEFLKGHPGMGHCLHGNIYVSNEGLRHTIHETQLDKQKVEKAFRDFTVKEIAKIRKEWPNFAYTKEHLNQSMINQINIVLAERKTELGL